MSKPIIEIRNVSKKHILRHESQSDPNSLKEAVSRSIGNGIRQIGRLFGGKAPAKNSFYEEFYALKDITLDIQEGDRLGIIGNNGSGKSTLLKIISRIITPSSGHVKLRGKVASLLEVGTGFHPELTGRENIFLNGAVLGMSQSEIRKKFDEIVDFAGTEKFLDTPVKYYSSGMFTRLGFAVSAHLNPQILVVDEVLSVGDADFQTKCLKKMNDLAFSGMTILFVSHQIGSVLSICNKGLFLEKGVMRAAGDIEDCVKLYAPTEEIKNGNWEGAVGDNQIRVFGLSLDTPHEYNFTYHGDKPRVVIDYELLRTGPDLVIGIGVWNQFNQLIAYSYTGEVTTRGNIGIKRLFFDLDPSMFSPGEYMLKLDCYLPLGRKIIEGQAAFKFSIRAKEAALNQNISREGLYLGNKWSFA